MAAIMNQSQSRPSSIGPGTDSPGASQSSSSGGLQAEDAALLLLIQSSRLAHTSIQHGGHTALAGTQQSPAKWPSVATILLRPESMQPLQPDAAQHRHADKRIWQTAIDGIQVRKHGAALGGQPTQSTAEAQLDQITRQQINANRPEHGPGRLVMDQAASRPSSLPRVLFPSASDSVTGGSSSSIQLAAWLRPRSTGRRYESPSSSRQHGSREQEPEQGQHAGMYPRNSSRPLSTPALLAQLYAGRSDTGRAGAAGSAVPEAQSRVHDSRLHHQPQGQGPSHAGVGAYTAHIGAADGPGAVASSSSSGMPVRSWVQGRGRAAGAGMPVIPPPARMPWQMHGSTMKAPGSMQQQQQQQPRQALATAAYAPQRQQAGAASHAPPAAPAAAGAGGAGCMMPLLSAHDRTMSALHARSAAAARLQSALLRDALGQGLHAETSMASTTHESVYGHGGDDRAVTAGSTLQSQQAGTGQSISGTHAPTLMSAVDAGRSWTGWHAGAAQHDAHAANSSMQHALACMPWSYAAASQAPSTHGPHAGGGWGNPPGTQADMAMHPGMPWPSPAPLPHNALQVALGGLMHAALQPLHSAHALGGNHAEHASMHPAWSTQQQLLQGAAGAPLHARSTMARSSSHDVTEAYGGWGGTPVHEGWHLPPPSQPQPHTLPQHHAQHEHHPSIMHAGGALGHDMASVGMHGHAAASTATAQQHAHEPGCTPAPVHGTDAGSDAESASGRGALLGFLLVKHAGLARKRMLARTLHAWMDVHSARHREHQDADAEPEDHALRLSAAGSIRSTQSNAASHSLPSNHPQPHASTSLPTSHAASRRVSNADGGATRAHTKMQAQAHADAHAPSLAHGAAGSRRQSAASTSTSRQGPSPLAESAGQASTHYPELPPQHHGQVGVEVEGKEALLPAATHSMHGAGEAVQASSSRPGGSDGGVFDELHRMIHGMEALLAAVVPPGGGQQEQQQGQQLGAQGAALPTYGVSTEQMVREGASAVASLLGSGSGEGAVPGSMKTAFLSPQGGSEQMQLIVSGVQSYPPAAILASPVMVLRDGSLSATAHQPHALAAAAAAGSEAAEQPRTVPQHVLTGAQMQQAHAHGYAPPPPGAAPHVHAWESTSAAAVGAGGGGGGGPTKRSRHWPQPTALEEATDEYGTQRPGAAGVSSSSRGSGSSSGSKGPFSSSPASSSSSAISAAGGAWGMHAGPQHAPHARAHPATLHGVKTDPAWHGEDMHGDVVQLGQPVAAGLRASAAGPAAAADDGLLQQLAAMRMQLERIGRQVHADEDDEGADKDTSVDAESAPDEDVYADEDAAVDAYMHHMGSSGHGMDADGMHRAPTLSHWQAQQLAAHSAHGHAARTNGDWHGGQHENVLHVSGDARMGTASQQGWTQTAYGDAHSLAAAGRYIESSAAAAGPSARPSSSRQASRHLISSKGVSPGRRLHPPGTQLHAAAPPVVLDGPGMARMRLAAKARGAGSTGRQGPGSRPGKQGASNGRPPSPLHAHPRAAPAYGRSPGGRSLSPNAAAPHAHASMHMGPQLGPSKGSTAVPVRVGSARAAASGHGRGAAVHGLGGAGGYMRDGASEGGGAAGGGVCGVEALESRLLGELSALEVQLAGRRKAGAQRLH